MLQNPSYQEKLRQVSIPTEELVRVNQMIDGVVARKHEQTQAQEQARLAQGLPVPPGHARPVAVHQERDSRQAPLDHPGLVAQARRDNPSLENRRW